MPLCAISVDSVWPLYGPVAGGTRVTITGQVLNMSNVRAVDIGGQFKLYPDSVRLSLMTILTLSGMSFFRRVFNETFTTAANVAVKMR